MTFEKFNVSKPTKFISQGVEKTKWNNVGTITIFTKEDGTKSGRLELTTFDKDIELNVFPFKAKEQIAAYSQPVSSQDYSQPEPAFQGNEEINVKDIPF